MAESYAAFLRSYQEFLTTWRPYREMEKEMARLTTKQRKVLPKSDFAVPSKRGYPVNDPAHARNALSRVSQFGSPSEKKAVRAKVQAKYPGIGKGRKGGK